MWRLLIGHDRFHLAQAERALGLSDRRAGQRERHAD